MIDKKSMVYVLFIHYVALIGSVALYVKTIADDFFCTNTMDSNFQITIVTDKIVMIICLIIWFVTLISLVCILSEKKRKE